MTRGVTKGGAFGTKLDFSYRDGSVVPSGPSYHPHASTRFVNWRSARCRERLPELYHERGECCGCTACAFACPVGAVFMAEDEEGFEYPAVDAALCIGCGRCMSVCVFKGRLVRASDDCL